MHKLESEFALFNAASVGDVAEVQRLLAAGVSLKMRDILSGYTALHNAARAGHIVIVRLLVEQGADISDRHNTVCESPLACASLAGQTEVVGYLLTKGADPSELLYGDDKSLIDEARDNGFPQIVEMLQASLWQRG